jgi:hypothetical protein
MDFNLLALNVGDSRLAIGTFAGGELMQAQRIKAGSLRSSAAALPRTR